MLIHMMAISDFGEILIIPGLEARIILLKIWMFLRTLSMSSNVIQELVTSDR